MVTIADKTVLVTGANRGIGQALVNEAVARGARRVYAGTRQPLAHPDARVTPLTLDVTSAAQIHAAAGHVESLDILINNAGVFLFDDLTDRAALDRHLAVNFFGIYGVTQAFLPLLTRSQGAIVNNVSLMALAPLPLTPAYSISKAAAFSMTQSLRALLAARGVTVHAVLTGPTDTHMTRDLDIPKASPRTSPGPFATESRTGRRISSPTPCPRPSPRAGATAQPRRSNARMRRSSRQDPSRHKQGRDWRRMPGWAAGFPGWTTGARCLLPGPVPDGAPASSPSAAMANAKTAATAAADVKLTGGTGDARLQ